KVNLRFTWLNQVFRHPQVPSPRRLLPFPFSQRILPPARKEPMNGVATSQRGRRHFPSEESMVAEPSQLRGRMGDAFGGQKGLQFLRGKRLFEQTETVKR